jgi:hypothetical protein
VRIHQNKKNKKIATNGGLYNVETVGIWFLVRKLLLFLMVWAVVEEEKGETKIIALQLFKKLAIDRHVVAHLSHTAT